MEALLDVAAGEGEPTDGVDCFFFLAFSLLLSSTTANSASEKVGSTEIGSVGTEITCGTTTAGVTTRV